MYDDGLGLISALFVLILAFVALLVQVGICYLLFAGLKRLPARYREVEPYFAWLMLIPIAGFVFMWILLPFKIPDSLKRYFSENPAESLPLDYGRGMGLGAMISYTACIVPLINLIAWIPAFVCTTIYLVQFQRMVQKLPASSELPGDRLSQLEKIKKLLDSGALTPEEYAREKAKLL
jgi:uncharacterized membrane protein